jgi:hypothetical protein
MWCMIEKSDVDDINMIVYYMLYPAYKLVVVQRRESCG